MNCMHCTRELDITKVSYKFKVITNNLTLDKQNVYKFQHVTLVLSQFDGARLDLGSLVVNLCKQI